ncbi:hypothetical protein BFJ72_g1819 [Fusarium proliferatum]|uniref:AB hydrolase-1 domain-containing protein n=1 Tax=Gibberella intermedia TaxID=948311 RepID=A0A420U1E8_GIBIN|nr:hypothetical protein BFJ72_g1819 [Fusarium proliferatum]
MSISLLKRYLPISLALLLFYGSASRFTHGATSTASFYQYQNDRSPDDGSTLSRVIPVFDVIVGTTILQQGLSRKVATCFVASTITSVAFQRYLAGLDCQGDFLQVSWFDHARDMMKLINQHQRDIPHPIVGIGHSMGGTQLAQLALWHPRLLDSLVLIDPIIQIPNPSISLAGLSTKRRDIWPSREDAVARFKKSKFFQSWDPRVLDLWIEHGLRDVPTELYPKEGGSSPGERVTLTTSKHQELFSFVRPTYLARHWEPTNDQDPEQNKDCPEYPFHRPEPPKIFRHLPELRPSTLFVFGKQSEFSSPERRQEKMLTTGTGVGGSGGAAVGEVQEETLDCGHLIPMEKVSECADVISSFVGRESIRWRDQQGSFKRYRESMSRRQQITIDEQWEDKVKLGDKYLKS